MYEFYENWLGKIIYTGIETTVYIIYIYTYTYSIDRYIFMYTCTYAFIHIHTHTFQRVLVVVSNKMPYPFPLKALTKRVDAKISPDDNLKVEVSDQISLGWNGFRSESNLIDLLSIETLDILRMVRDHGDPNYIFVWLLICIWILPKNHAIKCSNVPFCSVADLFCIISQVSGHSPHVAFMTRTAIEPISSPDHASGGLQAGLGRHFGWRV